MKAKKAGGVEFCMSKPVLITYPCALQTHGYIYLHVLRIALVYKDVIF